MNRYMKQLRRKWLLLALTAIFTIVTGVIISNQSVTARPQEDVTIILSVEDAQSQVSYAIAVDNLENEILARIEYDTNNANGINKYREFNDQELTKILQNIAGTDSIPLKITFSSPLSQEEFTKFVEQYGIDVESYYIYMLESDGKIATIQGGPSEEALVPNMFFNATKNSIAQEYSPGVEFLGWVEVNGTVQSNRVPQIKSDQRVFLIDIMQLFLESKLTDEALADAGFTKGVRQNLIKFGFANIDQRPLAWDVYHLGLMKQNNPK